ncbi:MAG: UDP-N-acetylmuramoyl-L-alanyl-D-glutamate--2,6-diaminopimelate ligase [Syntrophobacteraceae bacterium]
MAIGRQMKLAQLVSALDVLEVRGDLDRDASGVVYDSRRVQGGDVFVAVRGALQDGHKYAGEAARKGAAAIVVEKFPEEIGPGDATLVRVADSRKALALLAAEFYGRPAEALTLIGVTGTNGKTTTTLLVEGILKEAGLSVGVIGTLSYRWDGVNQRASMTTPESLDLQRLFHDMRRDGVTHVVMEVSSHALAFGRVDGCRFRAGVFTNLSQDHLDLHKTMEDYLIAKSLLFRNYLDDDSAAIINLDDPNGERLVHETRGDVWTYSLSDRRARVWVKRMELGADGILSVIGTPGGDMEVRSSLLGRLNLYNVLSAAATALALGIPVETVARGLHAIDHVDGRLQRIPTSQKYEVIVDYAHTPDAMEKSLTCLRELTSGRLLVVFGCGGDRDRGKRPLMGRIAAQLGDLVFVTSDNPRSEEPDAIIRDIMGGIRDAGPSCGGPKEMSGLMRECFVEPDRKRAIELALDMARPGDVVFIGGKGHETHQIIGGKKFPFDDRQVVLEYLGRARRGAEG